LISQKRGVLSVVTRVIALVCAIASAILGVYCVMLVYAATTFEHDSLPGPAVLSMVAVGVGLAALLAGGLSSVLWRASKRPVTSAQPARKFGHEG
jgi:TRAP-type C4-dicarboxylate transport system permease small subunit